MFKKLSEVQNTLLTTLVALVFVGTAVTLRAEQTEPADTIRWKKLAEGLDLYEWSLPEKSILNDSKLTIVRINANRFSFHLLCSSQYQNRNRTADEWASEFGMVVTFNAGMYNPSNGRQSKGYMKNGKHLNNPKINPDYNVMMALDPQMSGSPSMQIFDLTTQRWDSIQTRFGAFSQVMRMIDSDGAAMQWNKRPWQACSMIICGTDAQGLIYLFFVRSPYTHQKIIDWIVQLPLAIRTTGYLEGGPETSLYINTGDTIIAKQGSYVSRTYENDNNNHFWKIPNVIGIKLK